MTVRTNTPSTLLPMPERYTADQLERRSIRMKARATVAAQLKGQQNYRDQLMSAFISMPALTRLRWVLFGKHLQDWRGNLILLVLVALVVTALWLSQS
jgi:hypothetical protein